MNLGHAELLEVFSVKICVIWDQELDNYLKFGGSMLSLRIQTNLRLYEKKATKTL